MAAERKSPCNPEFVAMAKQAKKDVKNGIGSSMTLDELDKFCK